MKKNQKESKEILPLNLYFILLLILGLVIIFEAVSVANILGIKQRLSQISQTSKIIPKPVEVRPPEIKKGIMKITLEKNQKIIPKTNLYAQIIFNSFQEPIGGIDAILTFDPKLVSVVNITENKEIFGQIIINKQKEKEGVIKITAYQPTKTLQEEQTLALLTLRLLENKPAVLKIDFKGPDVVTDSNLVSQETQKDILRSVQFLSLTPENK